MPSIIKPLSNEISVSTANTVSGAVVVRTYASANSLVTVADANTDVKGQFTIPVGTVEYIEKTPTDTVSANVAVFCTSVAYKT